jgi:Zn finger protein HypA/HybF involved in hydrogenase expression
MHEMSVAMEVCRIAQDQVGFEALANVREIGVVVGRDSGVEPDSLRFCLEALLGSEPFRGARAALDITPGDDLRVSYLEIDDDGPPN